MYTQKKLIDFFSWDIYNWSRSLDFWQREIVIEDNKFECLDIGAGFGGLSLWLAIHGNNVLCTEYSGDLSEAKKLHMHYHVQHQINYLRLDVKTIPYENKFDIIILKSVLGGIGSNEDIKSALAEIHKALKPGGCFLFVENLKGSLLLMKLRKFFSPCGNSWNYLDYNFFRNSLGIFNVMKLERFGVLGRNNLQQKILGKMAKFCFEKVMPKSCFYIVSGVAFK
jgi:SAM-dependent methyltransferase